MKALSTYISTLLFDHDCVIIPGFGGIVGNRKPAWFNEVNQRFYPAYKELGFNQNLKNNDGLLANQIAQEEELDFNAALEFISTEVLKIQSELARSKKFELEEVGNFKRDADSNLRFEQDLSFNYLKASYGLEPVQVVGLKINSTREKVASASPSVAVHAKRPIRRAIVGAYALAAIPLAGYLFWLGTSTPLLRQSQDFALSDLNPFGEKLCPTYEMRRGEVNVASWPESEGNILERLNLGDQGVVGISFREEKVSDGLDAIYVRLGASAAPDKTEVAVNRIPSMPSSTGSYHIIAGCFSIQSNAQGLVDALERQGYNARVLDQRKGLWRVSMQSYASKRQAKAALSEVRSSQNEGAWLVKK